MRDTLVLSLALAGLIGSVHDPSPITKFVIVKLVIFTISPMAVSAADKGSHFSRYGPEPVIQ
jgi:hypothetical protein